MTLNSSDHYPFAPYKYDPLVEEGAIRLLTLFPGQFLDDIVISIRMTTLSKDEKPVYEALSYVWGGPAKELVVLVSHEQSASNTTTQVYRSIFESTKTVDQIPLDNPRDKRLPETDSQPSVANKHSLLPTTKNLNEALRYLRREDQERALWIDANCIEQDNLQERAGQVRRMPQIYSTASRVVVWLGPEEADSTYAINTLCELGNKVDTHGFFHEKPLSIEGMTVDERGTIHLGVRSLYAVYGLLSRTWFERLWVRQEIYLGRERGIVQCGRSCWQWLSLSKGILALGTNTRRYPAVGQVDLQRLELTLERASKIANDQDLRMLHLLAMARGANCTDPRDKVFAVLGMVGKLDRDMSDLVSIDYANTTTKVYAELFRLGMNRRKHLQLLLHCDNGRGGDFRPTWSPDWSRPSLMDTVPRQYADANASMSAEIIDFLQLRTYGCVAAKVKSTKPTAVSKSDTLRKVTARLKSALKPLELEAPYQIPDTVLDAYCYVLTNGLLKGHRVPPFHNDCSADSVKAIINALLKDDIEDLRKDFDDISTFMGNVRLVCSGRAWITTESGLIGLAPSSVQPGDLICVLLGCPNLVALTPSRHGRHEVLGCCYVHGLNWGEALLGPLPNEVKLVQVEHSRTSRSLSWMFQDEATGKMAAWDPRVMWDELLAEKCHPDIWRTKRQSKAETLCFRKPDADYFRKHGVKIEEFLLV